MDNLLAGVGIMMILFIAVVMVIAALILWGCAKGIGKIENANFGNSFLVVLAAMGVSFIVNMILPASIYLSLGMWGALFLGIILQTTYYVVAGKLIWNCSWEQSMKAYSVIFALHLVLSIAGGNALANFMGSF